MIDDDLRDVRKPIIKKKIKKYGIFDSFDRAADRELTKLVRRWNLNKK